jgi:3-hydroxyacyl-CoA dehydrogenase
MKFAALRASAHPQAQFLWSIFRDVFHYCAVHLGDIADNARDVDFAMRWGFGWQTGPFETWQAAGWKACRRMVREDIAAGRTMSDAPLPAWVFERSAARACAAGSWSAATAALQPRSALPVYARQLFPEQVLGEMPRSRGTPCGKATACGCGRRGRWCASPCCLSRASMSAIGPTCWTACIEAIARAERDYKTRW